MSQLTGQQKLVEAFNRQDFAAIAALVKSGEVDLNHMSPSVREKVYLADPSVKPPGAGGRRRKTRHRKSRRRHGRKTRRSRK